MNDGVVFSVEYSDTLAAGSWSTASDPGTVLSENGFVQQVKVIVPAGSGPKRFVRMKASK